MKGKMCMRDRDGHVVKEILVTCRRGSRTMDEWFPDTTLDSALVAEYWSALAQRQLAGARAGAPLGFPRPHQIPNSTGTAGLDVLGIGPPDAPPSGVEEP